jgi:hypothetical protein
MTDSTSPAEPRDLPEQIADSSELSTLGRTLLRRYDHAGVIRTAGIMARSRRHQAIGAHVTSLSRTLQRRWLPGAVGSDLTRPVLVFRQSEPAEAARQPSAVGPPMQPVLPQVEPAAGRTAPVRVQNTEPVPDTPRAVSVQRRAREPLHRLPGNADEPDAVMTATAGLPALARQQAPVVYPSAHRTPIRSIGGQLRRSAARGAATFGLDAAALRRQELAPGRQLMARRSEPDVTSAAPAVMTVVAARQPHPSTAPGAELVSIVQATPSTGLDPATIGGREVAPASPPLARRSAHGVSSPAATGIAVVAARRSHQSRIMGAGQSANTALHTQASRSLARHAATTTAFGSAMVHRLLDAPVRRLARNEDLPAPGISRKPMAAITSPGAAALLGRAEIARGALPLGIAKMDSKIVVPAQAPQEIVARSALPLADSINRLPPRDDSSLDDVAGATRPAIGSDAIGGIEQRLAPGIARAAETPALHGAPSATALGQTTGQPDRRMPVQSRSGSPVSPRDFDIVQPAVRRLPEAMDSVLPLALSPAHSAGATRQAMAQRAVASPSSVVFTAAETAPASPGAAAGAPPENGASPSPQ